MLSATPVLDGVYQGVLVAFLLLFRITVANTLTAYALMVFVVMLIIWLILGSWGLIRTQLNLRDLISPTQDLVQEDEMVV